MDATVVCSTPTYALRMAQEAAALGIDLAGGPVQRVLILSGEPAGSIPATKKLIEEQWGAKAADTAGMTELGTIMMFECDHQPGGAHIIEDHFIEEVIDPETDEPVAYGEQGERVVTSFGRGFIPVLRYRTRDLVVQVPASTLHLRADLRHLRRRHPRARRRHEARPRHERLPARGRGDRPRRDGDRRVPDPPLHGGRASATRSRCSSSAADGDAEGDPLLTELKRELARGARGAALRRAGSPSASRCRASS